MVAFRAKYVSQKTYLRPFSIPYRIGKEGHRMLKTDLKVETVGEPDIMALTESERLLFLDTLLSSIADLYNESRSQHDGK